MLKTLLATLEAHSRWVMGGFTVILVVALYVLFPIMDRLGFTGSGKRPHDPTMVYSSLTTGDVVVEYPYASLQDCEKFRAEFLAKSLNISACKLGSELDAAK